MHETTVMTKISRYLLFSSSCILLACISSADKPWWLKISEKQGPMVCAEEWVRSSNRTFSVPWTEGKMCGAETIVRFSCCHGYEELQGERGCPLVKPMKNLLDTAIALGASEFAKQADLSGISPLLSDQGAFTVFVALNPAFYELTKDQEKALTKKSRGRPPVLLYTVVEGRVLAEDLPDTLTTLYRDGSASVVKFSSGLITINCIPLIARNIESTNGIIHITESLLLPPGRNSISDILLRNPASSTFSNFVQTHLPSDLKDKKSITFFSPTEEAWNSLPATLAETLLGQPSLLKILLEHHMVDSIWCSAMTASTMELQSVESSSIQVSCNESEYFVNRAKIFEKNIPARNGFLHYIDAVLIPDQIRSFIDYMGIRGLTQFPKLVEVSGLQPLLQRKDMYTVFVPTDDAFEALENETLSEIFNQPNLAREIVSSHLVSGRHLASHLIDGQTLQTLETFLRVKTHRKIVTVEAAFLLEKDLQVRNGVVQIIDKILMPPTSNILDELQQGNFSIFTNLLNESNPNLLEVLKNSSSTFTLFAPSDEALNGSMPPGMLTRLLSDTQMLYKITSRHILPTFVVSAGLEPGFTYSFECTSGDLVTVSKETSNSLTVSGLAEVTRADVVVKNGVIHEVSRLLQI